MSQIVNCLAGQVVKGARLSAGGVTIDVTAVHIRFQQREQQIIIKYCKEMDIYTKEDTVTSPNVFSL